MLGPEDLVLCAGTLLQAPFREKVEAAGKAGFAGLSLWLHDVKRARESGLSDADMRAMLDDHGLVVAELDPLLSWIPDSGPGANAGSMAKAFLATTDRDFFEVADAIGARSLNLAQGFGATIDLDAAVEGFAGVCDRAAEHGLSISLEFLPWSGIPDAATALEIVERADRKNGGLMLDVWHHFRSGEGDDALRAVPGAKVVGIQLNDAPRERPEDIVGESMNSRLVPGEGAIDLVAFVRILDEIGSRAPIGIEIFSQVLNALPPVEVARRVAEATRDVIARARAAR